MPVGRAVMNLDVQTLMVVMMINMIALAVALPSIMGWRVGRAARHAQGAVAAQTVGWILLVLGSGPWARPIAVAAMAALALGQALMWEAMHGWLGRRPGRALVWVLAVAMPLGYALTYDHYAWRVGLSNFALAAQMATVCLAVLWPAPEASRRWRLLIAGCLAAMAVATAWRGVLGAFFTELYPSFRTPHPVNLVAALISNLSLVLSTVAILVAWREEAERALDALARTDALTGLLNRRAMREAAELQLAQASRHGDPMALLLIDIDHFKQVNDSRGHATGDRALALLAQMLRSAARRGDLVARWGGEEFCVLLARTDGAAATSFDRRLRQALAARSAAELGLTLSFSSGLATLQPGDGGLDALLQRADSALYAAKSAGRGCLVDGDGASAAVVLSALLPADGGRRDGKGTAASPPAPTVTITPAEAPADLPLDESFTPAAANP